MILPTGTSVLCNDIRSQDNELHALLCTHSEYLLLPQLYSLPKAFDCLLVPGVGTRDYMHFKSRLRTSSSFFASTLSS